MSQSRHGRCTCLLKILQVYLYEYYVMIVFWSTNVLCLTVDLDASPPVDLPLTHFMWDDCIAAFQVKYALLIHMWQMCAFPERRVTAVGVRWFVFGSTGVLYTLCSCRMPYTTPRAALITFSRSSVGGAAVPSSKSLNVLTLPRLQMQECRQYV